MSYNDTLYDVVIVGGGPAGLSAALYAARDKSKTLVIEKNYLGGQIAITNEVENYPGILMTSGPEITESMRQQAEKFGAEFLYDDVTNIVISSKSDVKELHTLGSGLIKTLNVLVCTGAYPRPGGFEGEQEYAGRGVSYCATCDASFYRGKTVYVIGGGYAATEEAVYLSKIVDKVIMVVRRDKFSAPETVTEPVLANEKIEVRFNHNVLKVEGEKGIEKVTLYNNKTEETYVDEYDTNVGIFVFTGYVPQTDLVRNFADFDDSGAVLTNKDMETKTPGIYCAGDIRGKHLRQLVTAASDGAIAAHAIGRWLSDYKFKQSQK